MPTRKKPPAKAHDNMPAEVTDITDIVKTKRRHGPDPLTYGAEFAEPGDNARYLRMARASMHLQPIDIADPKQVANRIDEYFDFCEQNDRKPNMIGMANWLGIDRSTLNSWKRGEYRTDTHSPIIQKAVEMLEELWIDYMQNGKMNPAAGIFIAKNLFQYSDTQQIVLTPNNPMQNVNEEQASQRMIESMPDDE